MRIIPINKAEYWQKRKRFANSVKKVPCGYVWISFGCDKNTGNVIENVILCQPLEYCMLFNYNYVPSISLQSQLLQQVQVT